MVEHKNSEFQEEELALYERQLSLPEIGLNGQKLLKSSSVLCVGSGGLGSPVLLYLAAAGVGRIGIVDFDLVENSNLHRQVIHSFNWVGKPKVESAKNRIIQINPYCKVETYKKILNKSNALDIFETYDIICDCADNFPTKYLINDACLILNKPSIYGSISGFDGHASVFNLKNNSPNLRDFIPEPPPNDLIPSCSDRGVLGILPGIIGLIQATEILKIITHNGQTLNERILIFNALSMKFKELSLKHNKQRESIKSLIEYNGFCFNEEIRSLKHSIKSISIEDLEKLIKNNSKDLIIIDVRDSHEYQIDSINIAQSFPLKYIQNGSSIEIIKEIAKGKDLYVYCQTGKRSLEALIELKSHGITGKNVLGGIESWNKLIS